MKICYIPSKKQEYIFYAATGASFNEKISGAMETAMSNAINKCVVQPFHSWCHNIWCWFVDISLPACTTISLISLMLYMIGVKKARQWIIIPILVYLFIISANAMME